MPVEILSIHVPKTAGVTFAEYLKRVYGPDQVFVDNTGDDSPEIGPDIRVLHGHFPYEKHAGAYPDAKPIIWLRDPLRRLASHYFFWMALPPEENYLQDPLHREMVESQLSFAEFCELPDMRNLQSAMVGDHPLERFHFVGIQEHFVEDLCWLQGYFGWPEIALDTHHWNADPNYKINVQRILSDAAVVEKVLSLNEEDVKLFEQALELRAQSR